jgi:peroxiredoxin family protein
MAAVIAVILQSGDPERLYLALSLLVSAAAEGRPARGLAMFGALGPLLADVPGGPAPHVIPAEREPFLRTLAELRDTARELEDCALWACAAAVQATGAAPEAVAARLDGIRSTPRFLREVAGAQLVVV